MKARIDDELCTGCGLCPDTCPAVFEMGDDDLAHTKVDIVPPEEEDACREAAEDCPAEAILIED